MAKALVTSLDLEDNLQIVSAECVCVCSCNYLPQNLTMKDKKKRKVSVDFKHVVNDSQYSMLTESKKTDSKQINSFLSVPGSI